MQTTAAFVQGFGEWNYDTEQNKLIVHILLVSAAASVAQSLFKSPYPVLEDSNGVNAPASLMDMRMPPLAPNFLCGQDVYSRMTTGAADRPAGEKMEAMMLAPADCKPPLNSWS